MLRSKLKINNLLEFTYDSKDHIFISSKETINSHSSSREIVIIGFPRCFSSAFPSTYTLYSVASGQTLQETVAMFALAGLVRTACNL